TARRRGVGSGWRLSFDSGTCRRFRSVWAAPDQLTLQHRVAHRNLASAKCARCGVVTKKTADERRSARANVLLVGTVECGGVQIRLRIANLSAHGGLVVADGLPAEGTQLTLRCNGATVQSWIAWVRTPHAGIQFGEPIDPDELLRNAPPAQAQMITRDNRKV